MENMDKITKEELMKKLNLTEEKLAKVAGGTLVNSVASCKQNCDDREIAEMHQCEEMFLDNKEELDKCIMSLTISHYNCVKSCEPLSV